MAYLDFITSLHHRTARDYLERVARGDKAACAAVAKQFGCDYWDGDRRYGYGGFRYDGRWQPVARALVAHYGLHAGQRVLDVGCGKGFLLYDLQCAVPGLAVRGVDISAYAIEHAKPEVRGQLDCGTAVALPYADKSFDLVLSINTLHNLYLYDLVAALKEIQRVQRHGAYIVAESYQTEAQKANLLHWQLTCEAFYTPAEWDYIFSLAGYTGDHAFIFFD
jgi:SAM-dependent methyltransferase